MKEKKMAKYVVAEGFVVAGKPAGSVLKAEDVEHLDAMIASGRVIFGRPISSAKIDPVNVNASEEDET